MLALALSFLIHLLLIYSGGRALPSWENLVIKAAPLQVELEQTAAEITPSPAAQPKALIVPGTPDRPAQRAQPDPAGPTRDGVERNQPPWQPAAAIEEQEASSEIPQAAQDVRPAAAALIEKQAEPSAPAGPERNIAAANSSVPQVSSVAVMSDRPAIDLAEIARRSASGKTPIQFGERSKVVGFNEPDIRYAMYINSLRSKLEQVGRLNYPHAAGANLSGSLRVKFAIRADGSLENFSIVRSSGYPVLDAGAEKIVRLTAPYTPLPENIRRETDVLILNFTWTFSGSALSLN
jgi:protein TonB